MLLWFWYKTTQELSIGVHPLATLHLRSTDTGAEM